MYPSEERAGAGDRSRQGIATPGDEAVTEWRRSLAVYWDRRMLVILVLGFSSGLPFLLTGATLAIRMTQAGIDIAAVGLFALVGLPYNLKFLWSPVVDHVRLPWLSRRLGRRRAWAAAIQLLLMAAVVWLGSVDPAASVASLAAAALVVAFLSASQDIVIDAYRIESLYDDEQGAGSAMTQMGYRFGLLAAGAGALYLADAVDWTWAYAVEAALVLAGLAAILFGPEPVRGKREEEARAARPPPRWLKHAVVDPFADFARRPDWAAILLFILLYKLGDAYAGVMANPFYVKLGFTNVEIANVSKLFGMVATLAGVFLGGAVVYRLGILPALLACGVLQMLSNLMFAAQAVVGRDVAFLALTIGVENVSGGMGSAAFVAYLSSLCAVEYTATQYALLSSLMAVGRTVIAASSGWLAAETGWALFFVLSTVIALPGLILLVWMMRRLPARAGAG
jgi:PAT family beta-lactamase induction signal transducer AmpG